MSTDICEICGEKNKGTVFFLPLHQPNGSLITMACEKCARASSAFCQKHDCIHQGFQDGSTACITCVEELVLKIRQDKGGYSKPPKIAEVFAAIKEEFLPAEFEDLFEAAKTAQAVTGAPVDVCIIQFIAAKACRSHKSFDDVLVTALCEKSAECILS